MRDEMMMVFTFFALFKDGRYSYTRCCCVYTFYGREKEGYVWLILCGYCDDVGGRKRLICL